MPRKYWHYGLSRSHGISERCERHYRNPTRTHLGGYDSSVVSVGLQGHVRRSVSLLSGGVGKGSEEQDKGDQTAIIDFTPPLF